MLPLGDFHRHVANSHKRLVISSDMQREDEKSIRSEFYTSCEERRSTAYGEKESLIKKSRAKGGRGKFSFCAS